MTAKIKTTPYDSAAYLNSPEDVALYLDEAFADGDPALIAHALGVAARARGMTGIAHETNLSREHLYRALSAEGNPELATLIKVLSALGVKLAVQPDKAHDKRPRS
jgi:probable addiction module antidote protein